jgi:hypothetical protein
MQKTRTWRRALLVWLLIIGVESLHGTLRVLLVEPVLGSLPARQLAMPVGLALIFAITWLMIGWIGAREPGQLWRIGFIWVALTLAFETALGLAQGFGLERMTEDYDPRRGGLMLLGLAGMAAAPWLAARWRGLTP